MSRSLVLVFCLIHLLASAQQSPSARNVELVQIASKLKDAVGEVFWEEWKDIPMISLLVEEHYEYVFNYTPLDSSFRQDSLSGLYFRPRTQGLDLLATFPLVDWKTTMVLGTPENTAVQSDLHWLLTVIHEHFHQLQYTQPRYFQGSKELALAQGENDYLWPLNFPFPYNNQKVVQQLFEMRKTLKNALSDTSLVSTYRAQKAQLQAIISEKEYRYLNFQLWQEGFARFMEIKVLEYWLNNYHELGILQFEKDELIGLKSYYQSQLEKELLDPYFFQKGRVQFYIMGAAEALLIEVINSEWKPQYFSSLFTTDEMLKP